jgi:hypothetical protein
MPFFGIKGKLYRSNTNTAITNTTWSASGWDEVTAVTDLSLPLDTAEADSTSRANNGWEQTVNVLKRGELTFELIYDPADVDYQSIRDAYLNGTELAMAVLDSAIANTSEGMVSNFSITGFGRVENSDEQFGRAMRGDAIERAATALMEDLADFFPSGKRQMLKKVLSKVTALTDKAIQKANQRLDSPEFDRLVEETLNASSGGLPGSSGSTPDPSHSAS